MGLQALCCYLVTITGSLWYLCYDYWYRQRIQVLVQLTGWHCNLFWQKTHKPTLIKGLELHCSPSAIFFHSIKSLNNQMFSLLQCNWFNLIITQTCFLQLNVCCPWIFSWWTSSCWFSESLWYFWFEFEVIVRKMWVVEQRWAISTIYLVITNTFNQVLSYWMEPLSLQLPKTQTIESSCKCCSLQSK